MSRPRSTPASPITTPPSTATAPVADAAAVQDFIAAGEILGSACFGCGPDVPHGLHIQRTGRDGTTAFAEFTVIPEHQGAPGLAHGGLLATAMDEILGTSAWLLGRRYVTGRLETDYLAPVPVGSLVHLRSWCKGVDGRKAYLEAEGRLGGPDGRVAVRAAALFIEVPLEHFTAKGTP
ncbi:PaaI family thioesterase [Thermomonospora umbrina]|uniref:Acyl-coenzyme A thioesterase THEM4 n=1 Tax=Thermomonospora umbrina TaxID=111806 RepID=A0A3D9ST63_9ACTN|nr:PaaI family thioesterase [Thermomonospora umbrina]REE97670.1 thioesterase superfamily protein [Thermomonospora umbrina]